MALSDFVWSSYPLYLAVPSHRPDWLGVQRLLAEWRIPQDSEAGRRAFARAMEQPFYRLIYIGKTRGIDPDFTVAGAGVYGPDAQRRFADAITEIDEKRRGAA